MPLPKISEIRDLSDEEIRSRILDAKKELFDLRFQKATRQLEKPHQFKHAKHRLSQLLTIERERELAKDQAIQEPSTTAVELETEEE